MNRRLDGYLSRKIQAVYPSGLVYVDESGPVEVWTLERAGEESLGLGGSFKAAREAIRVMISSAISTKETGGSDDRSE